MGEMEQAYLAALSHSDPSARLLAMYGDFAWNVMNDHPLGLQMAEETVKRDPSEPVYRITLIRMLVASGQHGEALKQTEDLKRLNIGGRLDADLRALPH
jgi:predicted Zn-dependent protease